MNAPNNYTVSKYFKGMYVYMREREGEKCECLLFPQMSAMTKAGRSQHHKPGNPYVSPI